MGSRPSSRRQGGEHSNGSVGNELETELRAENAKLQTKIAQLEQRQTPEVIREENERLRQENTGLRLQLDVVSLTHQTQTIPTWRHDQHSEQRRENKSLNDFRSSDHLTESKDVSELQRTKSDITNNYVERTEEISPTVIQKNKTSRKINPISIPQRMSDIEAYGKGLPLPDTKKIRKHIRRTRKKQLRADSGNSTGISMGHVVDDCNDNERGNSSPERTDQQDVFLGVYSFQSGADDSDRSCTSEAAKDDLLM